MRGARRVAIAIVWAIERGHSSCSLSGARQIDTFAGDLRRTRHIASDRGLVIGAGTVARASKSRQ